MVRELVGREEALRRARAALDDPRVVVVAGASGIGKTALADVLCAEWRRQGRRVVEIRGTHGLASLPFGALATYLRLASAESPTATAGRIAEAILAEGDVLVSVDDAHLLDPDSVGLLVALAAEPAVRLVLTVVSTGPVPADIAGLWARWPECRVELDPLDRGEIALLVEEVLGDPPDPHLLDRIVATTLGYPLYVTALAVELRRGGTGELPVDSGRLSGLFERQMSRLGRDERRLFDLVAFADSVPVALADALPYGGASGALEREGLVGRRGGRLEVAHPLLAAVAVSTLTIQGRRRCAADLLTAVSAVGEPDEVPAIVDRALAVGLVPDADILASAVQAAMDSFDFRRAVSLAARAPDAPRVAALRSEALRHVGEVPDEVPIGLDEATRTQMLSARAQALAFLERRFDEGVSVLERGLATVTEPANRTRLAMEMMVLSGLVGDLDSLLEAARSVGDGADVDTRLLAEATTLFAEGLTLSTASSAETYRRGLELVGRGVVDPLLPDRLEMSRIVVAFADGSIADGRARAAELGETPARGTLLMVEALLADAWLTPAAAAGLAAGALSALEEFDPLGNLPQARIIAAMRLAQAGSERAAGLLAALEEPVDAGAASIDSFMRDRAAAWMSWSEGDPDAGKLAAEAGRRAIEAGHRFWGLCSLVDAVRLGAGSQVAADVEQLAVARGSGLASLAARHARSATPDELWAVSRMWWRAGAPTYAMDAAVRSAVSGDVAHRALVQILDARGVVPLVGSVDDVEPALTGRQAEVVARVLDGSSNRELADALYLSRRTVENHLRHAYGALGLRDGRGELLDRYGWITERE